MTTTLAIHDPDIQLVALWRHGHSAHTQRAYRGDLVRAQVVMQRAPAAWTLPI
jgi:hypothetical protein